MVALFMPATMKRVMRPTTADHDQRGVGEGSVDAERMQVGQIVLISNWASGEWASATMSSPVVAAREPPPRASETVAGRWRPEGSTL